MLSVFTPPNLGVDLPTHGIPQRFNYYADVFYGTNYETEFNSYYEGNDNKELAAETSTTSRASFAFRSPLRRTSTSFCAN